MPAIGRLYLPREALAQAGILDHRSGRRAGASAPRRRPARRWSRARARISPRPTRSWRRCARRTRARAAHHGGGLPGDPAQGWSRAAGARRASACKVSKPRLLLDHPALRVHLMPRTGPHHRRRARRPRRRGPARGARRARRRARGDAAGRRPLPLLPRLRARHDDRQRQSSAAVGQSRGARLSARRIGAADRLVGPRQADFAFIDLADGRALDAAPQRRPSSRGGSSTRAAACRARTPLRLSARSRRCCWADADKPVGEVIACTGPALRAACCGRCCSPRSTSSRRRARRRSPARVIRETLLRGGQACRPLIARDGLSQALIEPALALARRRATRRSASASGCARSRSPATRVDGARFRRRDRDARRSAMRVILAVPPIVAAALVPGLRRADRVPRHRQRAFPPRRRRQTCRR